MPAKIKTNKIMTTYRGFELVVSREPSITGEVMIFYSAMRKTDSWFLDEGGSEQTSLRSVMSDLKITVDDYYENPSEYDEELEETV